MRLRSGFSLIELLIAVAILSVVTVYLFETFTVNQRAYSVVDEVTQTQQNSRAIADLIERDLRHAGFLVPAGGALCGVDSTTAADVLYVSDASAIDSTNELNPVLGAPFPGSNVNSGTNTFTTDLVLENPDRPAYDADGDGTLDSDFQVNAGVIVVDREDSSRGSACGRVTNVDPTTDQLAFQLVSAPLAPSAGGLSDLVVIPAHEYRVNAQLQLVRNGLVLAEDVEDLQVAYFIDLNGDDQIDPGEYRGDGVAPDFVANAVDIGSAKEVRASFVMRTRSQDVTFSQGQFQATENRTAPAGNDGFRRRVHRSSALLRNLAFRS